MSETIRFNENIMISPTCTICEEIFHTKVYGSDLEICPRCKSLGMRYLKELEILKLQYESQQCKIREKFKREVLNLYEPVN